MYVQDIFSDQESVSNTSTSAVKMPQNTSMKSYTCDKCGKKFTMYGYQAGWKYRTETIDGEATNEEVERIVGIEEIHDE